MSRDLAHQTSYPNEHSPNMETWNCRKRSTRSRRSIAARIVVVVVCGAVIVRDEYHHSQCALTRCCFAKCSGSIDVFWIFRVL